MHNAIDLRKFSDIVSDAGDGTHWVQAWRYSTWQHPIYGKIEITPEHGQRFKDHFDKGTYGQDLLINYEHGEDPAKGNKSAGQVLAIDPRSDGVFYKVKFTEPALQEIQAGEWRYLSPEYDDWTDPESGTKHKDVPLGLALTSRPFFKKMAPMNFSEIFAEKTKDVAIWSDAYIEALPDSAFLYIEQGGTDDGEGRTTPLSKRHFAYRDAKGFVDSTRLTAAIEELGNGKFAEAVAKAVKNKANSIIDDSKGVTEDMDKLKKFAELLGIKVEDTDTEETLEAKVKAFAETMEPLLKVKDETDKAKTFREAFPDEFARMEKLEAAQIEVDAKRFSETFANFDRTVEIEVEKDGAKVKETKIEKSGKGFSTVALDAIASVHKKFAEKTATTETLTELLDVLASVDAVVDFTEDGSSRDKDKDKTFSTENDPRKRFAEVVRGIVAEDKLPYRAALELATEREPELAAAYAGGAPRKEAN